MRNSSVSNNISGPYERHNTSLWQETSNADLGSSGNTIEANLFVGYKGHLLQLINDASANTLTGNILLALNTSASSSGPSIISIEIGASSGGPFSGNSYIGGFTDGHTVRAGEHQRADYDPMWITNTGFGRTNHPEDWTPSGSAPFNAGLIIEARPCYVACSAEQAAAT